MSLNELVNLLILFALAVLIGIEIGKRQAPRRRGGMSWRELGEMTKAIEEIMRTPHGDKEPDPFAEERATEHGAVTEVKRPVLDEEAMEKWAEEEDKPADPMTLFGEGKSRRVTSKDGSVTMELTDPEPDVPEPEPAVGPSLMTLEERADALRVHLGKDITVVRNGDGDTTVIVPDRPSIFFSRAEGLELVAQGDAVGTVVAV